MTHARALAGLSLACGAAVAQTTDDPRSLSPGDGVQVVEGASSVTEALQGQDGLRIQTLCTHCNTANIQVGGLTAGLVPISRDGFPVFGGLQTSLVLSVLPGDTIAAAEVVKGPGDAARSHAAAGGEVDLVSAATEELPWLEHAVEAGSFGLLGGAVRMSGAPVAGSDASIVFGHTEVRAVDDDRDGFNDVPAVDRDFVEGRLRLKPAADHTVELGGSFIEEGNRHGKGAYDPVRRVVDGEDGWTREDSLFQRHELRAGWQHAPPGGATLEVRLLGADRRQRQVSQVTAVDGFIPGATGLQERFRIREDNLWAGIAYRRPLGLSFRTAVGAEFERQDVDATNVEPLDALLGVASRPELATERVDVLSVYAKAGWSLTPSWDLELGVRRDELDLHTSVTTQTSHAVERRFAETSPRLELRFLPAPDVTLRLIAGRTLRPPRPILSEVCCGQRYQTTERVRPERGQTVGFEATYQPTPRVRAGLYFARTDFDDHVLRLAGDSTFFVQTWALANVPSARAERAEAALRWSPFARLTLDASATWLAFDNRGDPLVDVHVAPPSFDQLEVRSVRIDRIPYLPRRTASLAARLELRSGARVSVQAGYSGSMGIQQFERRPLDSELDADALRMTPGFWLVNLSGVAPLGRQLELVASVDNLTDRLQDDLGDPTTDFNWGPLSGTSMRVALKFHPQR